MTRSKPILIIQSVMAGLGILLGGAALADFIDPRFIGLAVLFLGAVQGGLAFYLSGANVEAKNVAVVMDGTTPLAGQASPMPTGEILHSQDTVEDVTPPPAKVGGTTGDV